MTAGEEPDPVAPAVRRRREDEEPLSAFEAQCAPDKYKRPTPTEILQNYPDGYEPKHLAMKPCLMKMRPEAQVTLSLQIFEAKWH